MPDPLEGLRPAPDPRDPRAPTLLRPRADGEPLEGRTVVLGLPYDGGIPSRPGARFGPKALREALASHGSFDGQRELGKVVDMGDLTLASMNGAASLACVEEASRNLFATGLGPSSIGGTMASPARCSANSPPRAPGCASRS